MNSVRVDLMENGTGNGTVAAWPGGPGTFFAEGTFDGGSVKLQAQSPNGTWVDVASASHSAAGTIDFALCPGQIRAVATTATAVYAYAIRY